MAESRTDLWTHLRLVDVCKALRADLDKLSEARPADCWLAPAIGGFIATWIADDPEAAAVLTEARDALEST